MAPLISLGIDRVGFKLSKVEVTCKMRILEGCNVEQLQLIKLVVVMRVNRSKCEKTNLIWRKYDVDIVVYLP